MDCHSCASFGEADRKSPETGVPGAKLQAGCRLTDLACEMRSIGMQHGRRCARSVRRASAQSGLAERPEWQAIGRKLGTRAQESASMNAFQG